MSRFVHDPSLFDLDNDEHGDIFGDFGGRGSPSSPTKSKESSADHGTEERILSPDELADLGTGGVNASSDLPSPGSVKSGDGSQYSVSSDASSNSSKSKYLYPKIDTVEDLLPEEVRWFHKESTDKKWTAFIGYDSLRIECKYREIQQRAAKAHEVKVLSDSNENDPDKEKDCSPEKSGNHKEEENDSERINVRGGLYEVDVTRKECYPIYWAKDNDQCCIVMRGTWFFDGTYQPIDECYADDVETEHMKMFMNHKICDESSMPSKGPQPVIHNLKFKEFHVDWNAVDKVYLHSETASSKFYRAVGSKLGLAKSGTRLHRGYCYEARMDDKPPDINNLVFVVHGIGQKMETGNIVRRCSELRECCRRGKEKYFPDLDTENQRVEFLPCEWRSNLRLDGDTVESITPQKVKGLRQMLNSSAMDIMYYTSPLYRSEITQCLQTELNRLYCMFCARHPYFEANGGKVSVVAHSLGAVITYDIITGWNPIQLYDQYVSHVIRSSAIIGNQIYFTLSNPEIEESCQKNEECADIVAELEEARKRVSDLEEKLLKSAANHQAKTSTLKFKLQNLFCVGSPLAVFLALRGVRPKGNGAQDHILPRSLCSRLYNIYHPSDPVAYRLEPLILKHYETLLPLRIHRFDASTKDAYEDMPRMAFVPKKSSPKKEKKKETSPAEDEIKEAQDDGEKTLSDTTQSSMSSSSSSSSWASIFKKKSNAQKSDQEKKLSAEMKVLDNLEKGSEADNDDEEWVNLEVKFVEVPGEEHPELEYRLDYQIKEGKMESAYVSALTSHTSYWQNIDVALFIMSQIFPSYGPR